MIKKICVFCSSSDLVDITYHEAAALLGTLLAKHGFDLVFGGGSTGLMGATSRAALENGGNVYGFITGFLIDHEGIVPGANSLEIVDTMHERKQKMYDHADAFIILPGGFGTLDELFEVMTWRQLNIHQKPIIVVNTDSYWDDLEKLFKNVIDNNFALPKHRQYLTFVDTPEQAIERLQVVG